MINKQCFRVVLYRLPKLSAEIAKTLSKFPQRGKYKSSFGEIFNTLNGRDYKTDCRAYENIIRGDKVIERSNRNA